MTIDLGALPGPWAAVAYVVTQLARTLVWLVVTPSQNVAQLGLWWVPFYWSAVYVFGCIGGWGSREVRQVRRGNDLFEVDPQRRGGQWVGNKAIAVIRFQVAGEAWLATTAVFIGYGGVSLLMLIGLVWDWLFVVAGVLLVLGALHVRRLHSVPWWEVESGPPD